MPAPRTAKEIRISRIKWFHEAPQERKAWAEYVACAEAAERGWFVPSSVLHPLAVEAKAVCPLPDFS